MISCPRLFTAFLIFINFVSRMKFIGAMQLWKTSKKFLHLKFSSTAKSIKSLIQCCISHIPIQAIRIITMALIRQYMTCPTIHRHLMQLTLELTHLLLPIRCHHTAIPTLTTIITGTIRILQHQRLLLLQHNVAIRLGKRINFRRDTTCTI